jgi:hypothetical protein
LLIFVTESENMKGIGKFIRYTLITFLLMMVLIGSVKPAGFVPQARAGGLGLTGEASLRSIILDTVLQWVKLFIINRVQRQMISWLFQPQYVCPEYLKIAGTDACLTMVGEWRQFMGNASEQARRETLKEVELLQIPPTFKTSLVQAMQPSDYYLDARYTLEDVVGQGNAENYYNDPLRYGSWDAWFESLKPQNNLLGQVIMLQDRYREEESSMRKAAEKSTEEKALVDRFECTMEDPQTGECIAWKTKDPVEFQKEIFKKVALADFEVVINLESLGHAIGSALSVYLETLFQRGIFSGTGGAPPPITDPCEGLSGDARQICECYNQPGNIEQCLAPIMPTPTMSPIPVEIVSPLPLPVEIQAPLPVPVICTNCD